MLERHIVEFYVAVFPLEHPVMDYDSIMEGVLSGHFLKRAC